MEPKPASSSELREAEQEELRKKRVWDPSDPYSIEASKAERLRMFGAEEVQRQDAEAFRRIQKRTLGELLQLNEKTEKEMKAFYEDFSRKRRERGGRHNKRF
jgi:hypothetical protein